jgi:hypothetical protein
VIDDSLTWLLLLFMFVVRAMSGFIETKVCHFHLIGRRLFSLQLLSVGVPDWRSIVHASASKIASNLVRPTCLPIVAQKMIDCVIGRGGYAVSGGDSQNNLAKGSEENLFYFLVHSLNLRHDKKSAHDIASCEWCRQSTFNPSRRRYEIRGL